MSEGIEIASGYEGWFQEQTFDGIASRFPLDLSAHRKRTLVCCETLASASGERLTVYFKVYASCSKASSGLFRRSRALCEAENLDRFKAWGIRTPDVVARGYRRRLGGLCSGQSFIITQAIEADSLLEFWKDVEMPCLAEDRLAMVSELAQQTRTLHAQQFYHQDLKWRNVLVDGEHKIWWIDCPSGHFGRFAWRQRHGRIKDLATLDIVAVDRCSAEERRHFISVYLDTDSDELIERWARDVVAYREKRFR